MQASLLLLLSLLIAASIAYRCSNRLYRGQQLLPGQYLCSRNLQYRLYLYTNGSVVIAEAFVRENFYKLPPSTLYTSQNAPVSPQYVTLSESGELTAVAADGSVYWRVNVTGGDFVELQSSGSAVVFSMVGGSAQALWKSLSMYSLRLVGVANVPNEGRLEIFYNNTWGSICSSGFDPWEAAVACRSLGYDSGQMITNSFSSSTGPIWLSDMMCRGNEDNLQQCAYNSGEQFWGTTTCSHSQDVAVRCQGTWIQGVIPPAAHVCIERLRVGNSLSLGDSLCAGANGEYALRFAYKRGDTMAVLEYKGRRKWSLGVKAQNVSNASLRLDADGIMRIYGTAAGLPLALNTETLVNASYLELQDNGAAKVVADNGTTGWRKAPEDTCYEEKSFYDIVGYDIDFFNSISLMACLDSCNASTTCAAALYWDSNDFNYQGCVRGSPCCVRKSGYSWSQDTGNDYYEKSPGCSSGLSCYTAFPQSNNPSYNIACPNSSPNPTDCSQKCDSYGSRCTNFIYTSSTSGCCVKWRRRNESFIASHFDAYFRSNPCSSIAPQQVSLQSSPACRTTLAPTEYLLPGERLCSSNGLHSVSVERDGRISLDGGQWLSGASSGRSALLQLTDKKQLLLRLDNGTVQWLVDLNRLLSGTLFSLSVSNSGLLQIVSGSNTVIWNHVIGYVVRIMATFPDNPLAALMVDWNNNTCTPALPMVRFSIGNVAFNTSVFSTLVGQSLQCGSGGAAGTHTLAMDKLRSSTSPLPGTYSFCNVVSSSATACRFECRCQLDTCDSAVFIMYNGCGGSQVSVCEVLLQ